MADVRRLVELGMVPPLAKEVASQIDSEPVAAGSVTNASVASDAGIATSKLEDGAALAPIVAAAETPAVYSETAADLAAVLVAAGLMEADAG